MLNVSFKFQIVFEFFLATVTFMFFNVVTWGDYFMFLGYMVSKEALILAPKATSRTYQIAKIVALG